MKVVLGLFCMCTASLAQPVGQLGGKVLLALDDQVIAEVNSDPSRTWTAARNPRFDGLTLEEARSLLMPSIATSQDRAFPPQRNDMPASVAASPVNFDSRDKWPNCVGAIRDQGSCGGCWAFAAAETLSDRFCIASNGLVNVTLSPEDLISCGHVRTPPKYLLGCNGGVPEYAWQYLEQTGISTDACIPFIGNATEQCPLQCKDGSSANTKFKVVAGSTRLLNGAGSAAQQYISQNGPIQAVFYVYHDFFSYSKGIYKHTDNSTYLGKHSVKIVGYGVEQGDAFWIAANSWGDQWGNDTSGKGFFRIGVGQCAIESEMVLGMPLLQ